MGPVRLDVDGVGIRTCPQGRITRAWSRPEPAVQFTSVSDARGGWLRRLMLIVKGTASMRELDERAEV